MIDCVIVGGGVIGLAIAYDLAQHGVKVRVVERGEIGGESSWAGAGIFPPAATNPHSPLERLTALSTHLYPQWCHQLTSESGMSLEYEHCGNWWIARDPAVQAKLLQLTQQWQTAGIRFREVTPEEFAQREPALADAPDLLAVYEHPDSTQVRNSRLCPALATAIAKLGGEVSSGTEVQGFTLVDKRIQTVHTSRGDIRAGSVVISTGAWSHQIGEELKLRLAVKPIRGQIVLLRTAERLMPRFLYEDEYYFVPRTDGHLLVGSTVEDVGFDHRNTSRVVERLLHWAQTMCPTLKQAEFVRAWAGLRPCSADGIPYLGRSARWANLYVAAGHFRAGLHLAPITGKVISQLIRGQKPELDLGPFAIDRHEAAHDEAAPGSRAQA